ncbi:MAG: hypothetical protein IPN07_07750 [Dehalococcoidia bacterium]|nr:hypothetical protein [Dehalococcoidia bacterium]
MHEKAFELLRKSPHGEPIFREFTALREQAVLTALSEWGVQASPAAPPDEPEEEG